MGKQTESKKVKRAKMRRKKGAVRQHNKKNKKKSPSGKFSLFALSEYKAKERALEVVKALSGEVRKRNMTYSDALFAIRSDIPREHHIWSVDQLKRLVRKN